MSPWWRSVLVLALVLAPLPAVAQVSPTAPAHPSMPWSGITTPQGQFIRFIYYPPQPVTIEYLAPAPASPAPESPPAESAPPAEGEAKGEAKDEAKGEEKPPEAAAPEESAPPAPQVVRQVVMIPGYYVRETTVGFEYPERWTLEQVGPGAYAWRVLPAQLIRR
jgi:hypothetical protein